MYRDDGHLSIAELSGRTFLCRDREMAITWTTYRLLCCITPELEAERGVLDAANARFAEQVTMRDWVLFALASPRSDFNPQISRSGVEANIRFCDFFLQMFGAEPADPAYREFVDLAVRCTADPAIPLRATVVVFRNPENAAEETALFREKLRGNPHCAVYDFHDSAELDTLADVILADWYARVQKPAHTGSAGV